MNTPTPKTENVDRLVLAAEARKLLGGMCASTMRKHIARGTLPPPTRLSKYVQGWPLSVLERVIRGERVAGRGEPA